MGIKKNIKIKDRAEFRRTLNEITNIPEMSLSPYILKSDMNLTETEFFQKYLYSDKISFNDFESLVNYLNKQLKENIAEIKKAKNEEQIKDLINKLIKLTSFRKLTETGKILKFEKVDNMKKNISKKANPQNILKTSDITNETISVITENQKPEIKVRFNSVPYTEEKAEAFNFITGLLKITPFNKKYGDLPVSNTNFYNMKSSKRNGQDFGLSGKTINKISDYFSIVINDIINTLSSQEQDKLKMSFEIFSGQAFQEENPEPVKNVTGKKEAKIKPVKESKKPLSKITVLTADASIALKSLCKILSLKSHYDQEGGVPISGFTLYHWSKPTTKTVSTKKLLPVLDYFKNIIKSENSLNLSDEDWKSVKHNWKIFKSDVSKIKDTAEMSKQEIVETSVSNLINEEIIDSKEENEKEFVLNYRYYILKKQESDRKLEEILQRRIQDRYNRDRLLKIQDALNDIPILSTLAMSKEKQFSEQVYEIKDFVISNKKGKASVSKDMILVDFISENPEVSSSKSNIYLNEDEYKQYQVIKAEAEKDQGKAEVKLILGVDGKLNLYFCFIY
jgi:hypothetical protein